ncbi:MAG: arsenate reductase ArsC [Nitrospirae bacterium]|nr:arsenate reductase ArsC [Nitrospirota bacterium]MCL5063343.1 arsenate reductase ArsC [Nitrospirota bacterium]
MNIELLYIKGCPDFKHARRLIHNTIKVLELKTPLKKIEIRNADDVKTYSFPGSPTIRINGEDIEPDTANTTGLTCRTYNNGTGIPDMEALKCKIARAARLKTVLFVYTGNAVRSQIAEAIVNHFMDNKWVAFSAGIMPMEINKDVIKVMKEIGIDISNKKSKHIDLFKNCSFDKVVTLCSDVDRFCLNYPDYDEKDTIIFHDPISTYGFSFGQGSLLRKLRDDIKKTLIKHLENNRI